MKFWGFSKSNNSSEDASVVAPSNCSAKNEMNSVKITDIAVAVSVLLCLIISILNICGLICSILALIIIYSMDWKRQPLCELNMLYSTAEH